MTEPYTTASQKLPVIFCIYGPGGVMWHHHNTHAAKALFVSRASSVSTAKRSRLLTNVSAKDVTVSSVRVANLEGKKKRGMEWRQRSQKTLRNPIWTAYSRGVHQGMGPYRTLRKVTGVIYSLAGGQGTWHIYHQWRICPGQRCCDLNSSIVYRLRDTVELSMLSRKSRRCERS